MQYSHCQQISAGKDRAKIRIIKKQRGERVGKRVAYHLVLCHWLGLISRGGVEDTRLEAKDTKKSEAKAKDSLSEDRPSRGQGQECSRPRTKDTPASVLQKKKGLQKSFSGNLQFIGVARIFDWGGLNHKSHAMTSSKICPLALSQDFAKGEGLK